MALDLNMFELATCWYQLEISMMIGSKVMTSNVFFTFELTLTFDLDL
jgi:hypothetical protein